MYRKYYRISLINPFIIAFFGVTIIHAAEPADQVAAPAQLEQESRVNAVPKVYLAAKQGRLEKLKSLIAAGADVNASNRNGRTVLMSAVYYRNKAIVRELLSEGVNVDAVDSQGRTALMLAVANNRVEMVNLLLASGADVKIEDKKQNTALTIAEKSSLSKTKKKKLVKILEQAAE